MRLEVEQMSVLAKDMIVAVLFRFLGYWIRDLIINEIPNFCKRFYFCLGNEI